MNATLKFTFEKETKGAVRYQEVGDDGAPAFAPQIGTLYIRKTAMPGGYPINVINNVRNVSEVATIYCATSNPVQVIVAKAETSRSVIGIVDGLSSRAIESEDDKQNGSKLLRDLGYKK